MRLDRFLVLKGFGSRKNVQKLIKSGEVFVCDVVIKDAKYKISENMKIRIDDLTYTYHEFSYYILNKPKGYVSAKVDNVHPTVIDLLKDEDFQTDIFPVGRLDLDTTGFLLLTNDGELAHKLLAPKKHVNKTYLVTILKPLTKDDIYKLESGVIILGEHMTKPAVVEVISNDQIHLTISEGKFHQVKEMLKAVDNEVVELSRITFAGVDIPNNLNYGDYIKVDYNYFNL